MGLPAVKLRAKPKTYAGYEQAIRFHIKPNLGKTKVSTLKPKHIQDSPEQRLRALVRTRLPGDRDQHEAR
jgi:hypothetical protein